MVKEIDNIGTIVYKNDNGEFHREDGPALIYPDGTKVWYKNGQKHRENGPAVIYRSGAKFWYKNGQKHRENGPAVIWPDGTKFWYKNGNRYSFDEWCENFNISNEEKVELVLKYG